MVILTATSANEKFNDCIVNEIGEVVIYGPQVSQGYTDIKLNHSFIGTTPCGYKTGDIGYIYNNGCLFIKGRNDTQIKWK